MGVLFSGVLYLIIGFVARVYPNILAGYNSMPQKDQEYATQNGLPHFASVTFILMGILCIFSYPASIWLEIPSLTSSVLLSVTLLGVIVLIIAGNLIANRR
ncbi:DUF3784 domain-containing protein [Belliella kenyensis]|uniref:DUF3784 domain-containing protein n=1 Tax=Belliella kenyensis TaxID=1472724 RepID=A0ABV8ESD4_9BACT|nr:DUF3784 domain-containing protein [Belliella kenyensis]MCH7402884.1 DUF3784 domain-containing protein [Belliella kenyensis]MDN3602590.1 DUF3784 domain-containing protein [Belliella kenyensis]